MHQERRHQRRRLPAILWALAVLGLVLPWIYNAIYFSQGGSLAPEVFFRDVSANPLTTGITIDVYLAAMTFAVLVASDRALGRRRWIFIALAFGVGLAFALPTYALQRWNQDG